MLFSKVVSHEELRLGKGWGEWRIFVDAAFSSRRKLGLFTNNI